MSLALRFVVCLFVFHPIFFFFFFLLIFPQSTCGTVRFSYNSFDNVSTSNERLVIGRFDFLLSRVFTISRSFSATPLLSPAMRRFSFHLVKLFFEWKALVPKERSFLRAPTLRPGN
jgi:hypothetical protein